MIIRKRSVYLASACALLTQLWSCSVQIDKVDIFGDGVGEEGEVPTDGDTEETSEDATEEDLEPLEDCPQDQVCFTINSATRHQISKYIYGSNSQSDISDASISLLRVGGNRWSAYNWETNASNAGSDWLHQNDGYLQGGDEPAGAVKQRVQQAQDGNIASLVTIPLLSHVAADKDGGGDVNQTPNYLSTRFHESRLNKGAPFSLNPDLNDGVVYQDEFINHIEQSFPEALGNSDRDIFYSLDNEPGLWSHTHARIQSEALTYEGFITKSIELAETIKRVAPDAQVFGPASYGWMGFENLQNAPDASNRHFLSTYLSRFQQQSQVAGTRLLDVADIHWYPEARGGGERITGTGTGADVVAARLQAPRSLWDPDYVEDSWIASSGTSGGIQLLPYMASIIDSSYPGTKLAITEYNYGAGGHISGGIATADVLGIFGRENIFAATLWRLNGAEPYNTGALRMYRNVDGQGQTVGDESLTSSTTDHERTSVYATSYSDDDSKMAIVAINKTNDVVTTRIDMLRGDTFQTAEVFQLTGSSSTPQSAEGVAFVGTRSLSYDMPPMSVSTILLSNGQVRPPSSSDGNPPTSGENDDQTPPPSGSDGGTDQDNSSDDSGDSEPGTDPAPVPPTPEGSLSLYDGESHLFQGGAAYDGNGSSAAQSSESPATGANHIRANINMDSWWGAAAITLGNGVDLSSYSTLRLSAKCDCDQPAMILLTDMSGNQTASPAPSIDLGADYQVFELPLTDLGQGVDLTQVSNMIVSFSLAGTQSFVVDIDDIVATGETQSADSFEVLFNGEDAGFSAASAWDSNGSTLELSDISPFSGTQHIRVNIEEAGYYGAASYLFNQWTPVRLVGESLVFQARANTPTTILVSLHDGAGAVSTTNTSIDLTTAYQRFEISLQELGGGVDLTQIQGIIFASSTGPGPYSFQVDVDDLSLKNPQ